MAHQALIVIDLQNDYFPGGNFPLWNPEVTLQNTVAAIHAAQKKKIPVILVQHVANASKGAAPFFNAETEGVKIHPVILEAENNGIVITKSYADSFHLTNLEATLAKLEVDELLICGMMTQNCVTHTAISKAAEKYTVKVLSDCCTTVSQMIHRIALNALSTRVSIVESAEAM